MPFVRDGEQVFSTRIKNYSSFDYEVIDIKKNKFKDPKGVKKWEAEAILNVLSPSDHVILLDEKGKSFTSRNFSNWLQQKMNLSYKSVVFVIGGAFGFDESLKKRSDGLVSISDMTFSHQLIRVIFLEQLYRAFTIIKNEKYHND